MELNLFFAAKERVLWSRGVALPGGRGMTLMMAFEKILPDGEMFKTNTKGVMLPLVED